MRLPPRALLAAAAVVLAVDVAVVAARSGSDADDLPRAAATSPDGDATDGPTAIPGSPTPQGGTAEDQGPDATGPEGDGAGASGDPDGDTGAGGDAGGDQGAGGDGRDGSGTTTPPDGDPDPPATSSPSPQPAPSSSPSPAAPPSPPTGDDGATPAPNTLRRPAEGTYTYAATGYQEVDVDGGRRTLPQTVRGSVDHGAERGWVLDLDAGEGSRDVYAHDVAGAALRLASWTVQRSFFGQSISTTYTCDPTDLHRLGGRQGRSVTVRCEGRDSTIEGTLEQLADQDVVLGDGSVVTAVRLRVEYRERGDGVEGSGTLEVWVERETGMRVRERRDVTSTRTSTLGRVDYREESDLRLESLTPS